MPETSGQHVTCGPGYSSPRDAMLHGPREKILYVNCIHTDPNKPDMLATVDVDPASSTYCQILEPEEMHKHGVATPHTAHCSPTGEIMISTLGNPSGDAVGDFLCIDSNTLEITGTWVKSEQKAKFGYDFWYQPYHDTLIATEWGVPNVFKRGFSADDPENVEVYGRSLNFYSWKNRTLQQVINLGEEGTTPLEVRFLHEPTSNIGYVGCAMHSAVYKFQKKEDGTWTADKVIKVPAKKVEGWITPYMSGMITDILVSLDDKYLYFSNWLHGDVRQYDITDRDHPRLVGQIFLGGSVLTDSKVRVIEDQELEKQPNPIYVKGRKLDGSPQMLQLSLDGTRLYVTTSLFKPWDQQFYAEHVKHGSVMVKLNVDIKNGGMKVDQDFLIDFGSDQSDVLLAHEMRYPGGDCTSDIWLAEETKL
ncbi:PREDICTED: selenium-binding protein 1-A isoform X2 [Ceratosolen solmsi marchali]|uniref:Selenium-binding protein 1-A isoform X2 n=1 Tax=Ceratosolen solmsi marchali TaxID=326594 RepID=A0AAJ6YET1_9HYME|nr:PREDICTED: selenium-binding protein 1-A isoform X2 [Ceratosolen solmsi marchali]